MPAKLLVKVGLLSPLPELHNGGLQVAMIDRNNKVQSGTLTDPEERESLDTLPGLAVDRQIVWTDGRVWQLSGSKWRSSKTALTWAGAFAAAGGVLGGLRKWKQAMSSRIVGSSMLLSADSEDDLPPTSPGGNSAVLEVESSLRQSGAHGDRHASGVALPPSMHPQSRRDVAPAR